MFCGRHSGSAWEPCGQESSQDLCCLPGMWLLSLYPPMVFRTLVFIFSFGVCRGWCSGLVPQLPLKPIWYLRTNLWKAFPVALWAISLMQKFCLITWRLFSMATRNLQQLFVVVTGFLNHAQRCSESIPASLLWGVFWWPGGPYGVPGIQPGSAACMVSTVPIILSLAPRNLKLFFFFLKDIKLLGPGV